MEGTSNHHHLVDGRGVLSDITKWRVHPTASRQRQTVRPLSDITKWRVHPTALVHEVQHEGLSDITKWRVHPTSEDWNHRGHWLSDITKWRVHPTSAILSGWPQLLSDISKWRVHPTNGAYLMNLRCAVRHHRMEGIFLEPSLWIVFCNLHLQVHPEELPRSDGGLRLPRKEYLYKASAWQNCLSCIRNSKNNTR